MHAMSAVCGTPVRLAVRTRICLTKPPYARATRPHPVNNNESPTRGLVISPVYG